LNGEKQGRIRAESRKKGAGVKTAWLVLIWVSNLTNREKKAAKSYFSLEHTDAQTKSGKKNRRREFSGG